MPETKKETTDTKKEIDPNGQAGAGDGDEGEGEEPEVLTRADLDKFGEDLIAKIASQKAPVKPEAKKEEGDPNRQITMAEAQEMVREQMEAVMTPVNNTTRDQLLAGIPDLDRDQQDQIRTFADKAMKTGFADNITQAVALAHRSVAPGQSAGKGADQEQQSKQGTGTSQQQRRSGRRTVKPLTAEEKQQQEVDAADAKVFADHNLEE